MTFNVKEPVDTVFTAVDKVAEIARIANSPLSDQQKIDMGYIILKKAKPFQSSLLKWDIRPMANRNWNKFKMFFRSVQVALRKSGSLTVEDGINHSELINMVSQGVKQAIEDSSPPQFETANNIQDENCLQEQLNEMKAMMAQLTSENHALQASKSNLQQQQSQPPPLSNVTNHQPFYPVPNLYFGPPTYNPNYQGFHYNQRGRGNGNNRFQQHRQYHGYQHQQNYGNQHQQYYNNQQQKYYGNQQQPKSYCWTHGMCGHNSAACQTLVPGHQRNATLDNRMGGNNRGV